MKTTPPQPARRGATLIEVLVVFAILSVLAGLLMTVLTRVRESANELTCRSNLKDLALAVHSHHTAKKQMPPYASGRMRELYGGWFVHLLPYVGQEAVYERLQNGQLVQRDGLRLFTDGRRLPGVEGVLYPQLICPSDPTDLPTIDAPTNYLANWFAFSDEQPGFYRPAQRFDDLADGLSAIVLFGEAYSFCDELPRLALYSTHYHNFGVTQEGWASDDAHYAPRDYTMFQVRPATCDKWRTQTPHTEMHIALADGSVRAVSRDISSATWAQALKPRDGQALGGDW